MPGGLARAALLAGRPNAEGDEESGVRLPLLAAAAAVAIPRARGRGTISTAEPALSLTGITKDALRQITEAGGDIILETAKSFRQSLREMERDSIARFPELQGPDHMALFKPVLAMTSPGQYPTQNYRIAATIWENRKLRQGGRKLGWLGFQRLTPERGRLPDGSFGILLDAHGNRIDLPCERYS